MRVIVLMMAIILVLSILGTQKGFASLGMEGLVAYYPLDGSAMNATGNSNHGTTVGGASWSDQGVLGGCLSVSRGHIQVGTRRDDRVMTYGRNQDFTWALWFKPSGANNDNEMLLSRRRYRGDDDQVAMHILYYSDGRVKMAFSADRISAVSGWSTSRCNDGNWHHVAVVRDVSTRKMRMYIDGVLESETDDNGWDFSAASSCRIGQEGETYGGNRQYHGLIDDVRIYNRALRRIEPQTSLANSDVPLETSALRISREFIGTIGWADWTKTYSDPTELAEEVIRKSGPFWTPLAHTTVKARSIIGGGIAMYGGAYVLLESPSIAADLVSGGFLKAGASISWDFVLAVIEQGMKTPKVLCRNISRATIRQGLEEYDVAYRIARRYIKTGTMSDRDAKEFLYSRWGIYKLLIGERLWNTSRKADFDISRSIAEKSAKEILSEVGRKYQENLGISKKLPIMQAAFAIKDVSTMMEQKRTGITTFEPYIEFRNQMDYINGLRIAEYNRFVIGKKTTRTNPSPERYRITIVNKSGRTLTVAYGTGGKKIRSVLLNGKAATGIPMGDGYELGNDVYVYERPPKQAKGSGWYDHHAFSYDGEKWVIR